VDPADDSDTRAEPSFQLSRHRSPDQRIARPADLDQIQHTSQANPGVCGPWPILGHRRAYYPNLPALSATVSHKTLVTASTANNPPDRRRDAAAGAPAVAAAPRPTGSGQG